MIKKNFFFTICAIGLVGFCATTCTDVGLEIKPKVNETVLDDKLTVKGDVCTLNPEDLQFPLRVVFLVDCSVSMEENDPPDPITLQTGREMAVVQAAEALLDASSEDVKISLIKFSGNPMALTPVKDKGGFVSSYFTDSIELIRDKAREFSVTTRTTNYISALEETYNHIRHELLNADQESLPLSTYSVIMISDGIPDVESNANSRNTRENILRTTDGLLDLADVFHVARLTFSTGFIRTGNPTADGVAHDLLEDMSKAGKGHFRDFDSGGELNFLEYGLTALTRVFTLKTLVANNSNAVVTRDEIWADSDGDGLSDRVEYLIGSNPFNPDSDGDGCRDGVERKIFGMDFDPIDPDDCNCFVADYCFDIKPADGLCDSGCLDQNNDNLCDCVDADLDGLCDASNYNDRDGDGLVDCEERYSGTNRNGPDSDRDGLVDLLEFRSGSAADFNDIADDLDWDAIPNGEEVRTGTDPMFADISGRADRAYRYNLVEVDPKGMSSCYEFEVSNITLVDTLEIGGNVPVAGPAGQGWSGWNRIYLYAGEVPFDDHLSYARFRIACVEASFESDGNYKNPPSGVMRVTDAHFHPLAEFDAQIHCVKPGGGN